MKAVSSCFIALVLVLVSLPLAAHVSEQGFVLLLPTKAYITGGVLAVVFTVVLLGFVSDRQARGLFRAKSLFMSPWLERWQTLSSLLALCLLPLRAGSVSLAEEVISELAPHDIPRRGIAYVPQGRRLFTEMSVAQNMEIGLMVSGAGNRTREKVLELFPRLRERLTQRADTLSGGEQQMLAMARALCTEPKVLLLDEPVEGLQPSMIALIRDVIVKLKAENVAIVLVEQQVEAVLAIADKVAFIEQGKNPQTVTAQTLRDDSSLLHRYLGV